MTKTFELWLDESGTFANDANEKSQPSLVGGILVESGTFDKNALNYVVPENKKYHSCEETDTYIRFSRVEEKLFVNDTNRMVVFSNSERVLILDKTLTYLNVISEGIIKLIKHLKSEYGDVHLKVLFSNYFVTGVENGLFPDQTTIPLKEYILRLKEKIVVEGYKSNIKDSEWEIENVSANDKRMMMADIVCNTFYTQDGRRKFNQSEREHIVSCYKDEKRTLVFTVESVLEKTFKNYLIENRIGEAVSNICLTKRKKLLDRSFSVLATRINTSGNQDVVFQYKFISAYIEYYINVVRDYDLCITLLDNLLEYYIPLLQKYEKNNNRMPSYSKSLRFDLMFYKLTVYTHKGDILKIKEIETECDEIVETLPTSLESVNYKIKYANRKIIGLIDAFKFEEALVEADTLVERSKGVKELLDLVGGNEDKYYDELGKALGTRLLIKTLLIRFNKELYEDAVNDSNEAIENFTSIYDKQRQYLYRAQLETAAENYDDALLYLKWATGVDQDCSAQILFDEVKKSPYRTSAYVSLLAEGARNNWKYSADLFNVNGLDSYISELFVKERYSHPDEIILWKYASYFSMNGHSVETSSKYYQKAVDSCFQRESDYSINVIGLAVYFEYLSYLITNNIGKNENKRKLRKKWEIVSNNDALGIVESVFGSVDFESDDAGYYYNLSRKITY